MKLILCKSCKDIVKLYVGWRRQCHCGASWGMYTDGLQATYGGQAIPLGIINSSFNDAVKNQPADGNGQQFEAFVIPKSCAIFTEEP